MIRGINYDALDLIYQDCVFGVVKLSNFTELSNILGALNLHHLSMIADLTNKA